MRVPWRSPDEPRRPEGVEVRVRTPAPPRLRRVAHPAERIPAPLLLAILASALFYVLAHASIVVGVWPVHGTAPGAGTLLVREGIALAAWLLVLAVLRSAGYRGNWWVVALPMMIFLLTRPALFQVFSDPVYQASGGTRVEANRLKAERSQLTTILRTYPQERQALVFEGTPPPLPDPLEVLRRSEWEGRSRLARLASHGSVFVAPLALLLGFAVARRPAVLRLFREGRRIPFAVAMLVFFVLTLFFTELGKVGGTTPWELLLPLFVATWAAVLADDAYNMGKIGSVVRPRRVVGMLLYGALPLVPFLLIRELGLSVVLAGSLAMMLLVGTRRGWWASLMMGVWAILVAMAFNLDERSANRLQLAYSPYRDVAEMSEPEAERWAARLHQIKLFDANVLAGGIFGEGAGRGHGETAPNAADDGFITLLAAQWGFTGTAAIVLIYTLFLVQMLSVAFREQSAFERTLVTGLALLIAIPFWLAVLGGLRVIPLTGVATAFAAHGGAKLLAAALSVGIIAGISHRRTEAERLEAARTSPAGEGERR
jgi:cell division protein FtsW (lipid II flippase)